MEHLLGFICGAAVGVGFVWLVIKLIKKVGGKVQIGISCFEKNSYDERQLIARGKAYRAGFFTIIIYFLAGSVIAEGTELTFLLSLGGIWLGVCIALLVFAVTCILKDAYMSLYENPKGVIILFVATALLNIAVGIGNVMHGDKFIENGEITVSSINMMLGILFLIIVGVFCGKLIYDRCQEDEE